MGKIWLRTAYGKLIHMSVVGSDANVPGDAIEIPTGVLVAVNRCYSTNAVIVSPTHGTITFDFQADGRTGSCNQCGMCCGHPVADCPNPPFECGYILNTRINWHVCQYLIIDRWNKWGDADNTECSLWGEILDRFKGCALSPISADKIRPWWTSCGFSFV